MIVGKIMKMHPNGRNEGLTAVTVNKYSTSSLG
jgi:hypothetical protein